MTAITEAHTGASGLRVWHRSIGIEVEWALPDGGAVGVRGTHVNLKLLVFLYRVAVGQDKGAGGPSVEFADDRFEPQNLFEYRSLLALWGDYKPISQYGTLNQMERRHCDELACRYHAGCPEQNTLSQDFTVLVALANQVRDDVLARRSTTDFDVGPNVQKVKQSELGLTGDYPPNQFRRHR